MWAAQNGHDQVRSSQLEYVDSYRQLLCARFHTFSSHHLEQVARALLENWADLEKQTAKGFTALMLSAQNGHDLCARALIEAKANLEAQQHQGFTALMLSAQNGHEPVCATRLQHLLLPP